MGIGMIGWTSLLLWIQVTFAKTPSSDYVSESVRSEEYDGLSRVINRTVRRIQRRRIMGSVVLVAHNDEIVYVDSRGWLHKKTRKEMAIDSLFRMYSLSKPVTSVAVLQLVERGLVDLNAPIGDYIEELTDLDVYAPLAHYQPIRQPTVSDFLMHTAGFTYGLFSVGPVDALYNVNHPLNAESSDAFIQRMAELPLAFEPGTQWRYSVSTDVLGVLVERVTQQSLGEYFQTQIFDPLGMVDTGFVVSEEQVARFGPMYTRFGVELETVEQSPFRTERFQSGGGGLVSTIGDYQRFAEMIVQNGTLDGIQILTPDSVALMQQNQLPNDIRAVNGDGFGYGFQVQLETNKQSPVGEYTWDGIGSTHFWADPEQDIYVIALSQYMPFVPVLKYSLRPRIYKSIRAMDDSE